MANNVVVNIVGDASKLKSALGQSEQALGTFESKLQSFGKSAVNLGKSLSLAVTLPIAAFGAVGFKELEDAGKAAAQTTAAIKSTGSAANVTAKQVDTLAASLMHKSGMDDEAIKSGENLLLTFTNIRNEAGKGNDIFDRATKAALDLSVALGKDMASSAVLVGKALNDPIAGLTALGRAGVQFSAAQKEQIRGFVEAGDIMSAQKVILAELTTQVGGSAEAYGKTLAGQVSRAREEFRNAAGVMLAVMAPAIKLVAGAVESFAGFLQKLDPAMRTAVSAFAAFAAALGPILIIVGKMSEGVSALIRFGGTLASAWQTMALQILYAADAIKAFGVAQALALGGIGLAVTAVMGLFVALSLSKNASDRAVASAKDWGKTQIENAKALGTNTQALASLQATQSVVTAKLREAREAQAAMQREQALSPAVTAAQIGALSNLGIEISGLEAKHKTLGTEISNMKRQQELAGIAENARKLELQGLATGTDEFSTATDEARGAVNDLQSALLAAAGGQLAYEAAVNNLEKAQADYTKAVEEHGPASQEAEDAELSLRQARLSAAEAAIQARDADDELKSKYKDTEAIQATITKLSQLRDEATNPSVKEELQARIDKLYATRDAINSIPSHKPVHIDILQTTTAPGGQTIERFATGGTVPGPQGKPRLAVVHGGEQILTPAQQATMGSGGTIVIPVYVGGRQVAEIVASELNRAGGPRISQRAIAN